MCGVLKQRRAITQAKRPSDGDVFMKAAMFSPVTMSERKTDGFIAEVAGDQPSSDFMGSFYNRLNFLVAV